MPEQMDAQLEQCLDRIREKLRKHFGFEKQSLSNPDLQLYRDLGLYGDDAGEFLEWFCKEFNISLASFRFTDYFPSEGHNPIRALANLLKWRKEHQNYKGMSLLELARAAQVGHLP